MIVSKADAAAAMRLCAGCHDQCMTATAEVRVSGDQTLVVSRVAALGLRLERSTATWDEEAARVLFYGLADGLQAEYCIFGGDGHRIEPYLRRLRTQAVARGLAPASVRAVAENVRATGNVFGIGEALSPATPARTGTILVHDAATRALSPASIPAALAVLRRVGVDAVELAVSSGGVVEADLGLEAEAEAAMGRVADAVQATGATRVIATDPILVTGLRGAQSAGKIEARIRVEHLAEALAATPINFAAIEPTTAVFHDPGWLSRALDATAAVRDVLGRIDGLDLREPINTGRRAHSDGPLAGYPDPRLAREIAARRLEELLWTNAATVLTASPYSLANLSAVAADVPVVDFAVFLDSVGGPR